MRERAFYYRGNRRLDPSRLDLAAPEHSALGWEDSRKEILMQRIRDSPLDLLDGIKIDLRNHDRSCKGKRIVYISKLIKLFDYYMIKFELRKQYNQLNREARQIND